MSDIGRSYSHAGHVDAVLKASRSEGSARLILLEVCRRADHKSPVTKFTKDQLCESLRICRDTVRVALTFLREEGSLVPLYVKGGRGHASIYRLAIVGRPTVTVRQGDKPAEPTEDERRELRFKALARKHGAARALEMMDDGPGHADA